MPDTPPTNEELRDATLTGANAALIGGQVVQIGSRQVSRVPLKDALEAYKLQSHLAHRDETGTGGFYLASMGGA